MKNIIFFIFFFIAKFSIYLNRCDFVMGCENLDEIFCVFHISFQWKVMKGPENEQWQNHENL